MSDFQTPPTGVSNSKQPTAAAGASTRKYVPYQKTPRTRRIGGQQSRLSRTPGAAEQEVQPSGIANKTWWAYKVTPLYMLSYAPADLRFYSKQLSAYIEAESAKGIGLECEQADTASFTVLKGLGRHEGDNEAVKITVKGKPHATTGERKDMLVAILCCVDSPRQLKAEEKFTCLPVLLTRGLMGTTSLLIAWLKSQFDCHVSHLTFSSFDLAWMIAIWAGSGNERRGAKPTELVYRVPTECEGLNTVTLTIEPADCQMLWTSIHDDNQDEYTAEEVAMFIQSVESHFYHNFRVKLAAMHLHRIGTSITYVGSEGRIKIFSEDFVHQILRHLTELALETAISSDKVAS